MNMKIILSLAFIMLITSNVFAIANTNSVIDGLYLNVNLLNQNPDPARAGEIIELRFSIQNQGNADADNLTATIDYGYPFFEIPGEENSRIINKIFPFQSSNNAQILRYKLFVDKDTPNGIYEINLKIKKANQEITNIYKFNISIIGKEYAQIITINKSNIDFGIVENLDFLITNTGNSPLKNIVFSWTESTETLLPVNSDNTKYIKFLDVGQSTTISYNVMANSNSTPGLYKLNLTLNFENENTINTTLNTIAGIFVGGKTDFDITFSESDSGIVSLSIANVGNNPAYSVNIIIPEQENYTTSGSNSSIIGNLDKGDYTISSFNISSKRIVDFNQSQPIENRTRTETMPTQNRNNLLKVKVEYTDSLGQRNSIIKEINIQQRTTTTLTNTTAAVSQFGRRTTTKNTNGYVYAIIGIIIMGVGIYGFKKYTKNANKKKI